MAISPMCPECLRMLSRKSLRSDIEASLMLSRNFGIVSHITCENLQVLTRGKYVCSNCSKVFRAGQYLCHIIDMCYTIDMCYRLHLICVQTALGSRETPPCSRPAPKIFGALSSDVKSTRVIPKPLQLADNQQNIN